ncbi:alpha-hydroxy acid oxidase [Bradyrhizobium sp. RDI18]|uniref:alpha-hydroxy acid oxidase n=1 Tax=Bradyrhizobium sp. RDI18 TaxID=3367400 RepID=UPI00371DBBBA
MHAGRLIATPAGCTRDDANSSASYAHASAACVASESFWIFVTITTFRPSARLEWQGVSHPAGCLALSCARWRGVACRISRTTTLRAARPSCRATCCGTLNWKHFEMIRRLWPGQLVIKGVLQACDAKTAVSAGAEGVIVSNHGGRQLDGAAAPLRVLPRVVEACPGVPVMLDSGIRRGSDVLKALALGAKFVFVGRPFSFAAAVAGEAGVLKCTELLELEVSRKMAMLGITALDNCVPNSSFLTESQSAMIGLQIKESRAQRWRSVTSRHSPTSPSPTSSTACGA